MNHLRKLLVNLEPLSTINRCCRVTGTEKVSSRVIGYIMRSFTRDTHFERQQQQQEQLRLHDFV